MVELAKFFETCLFWMANHQWVYLAYFIPFVIFLGRFYKKNKRDLQESFLEVAVWVRPSMESGGKASSEKLTAFAVTFVYIFSRIVFVFRVVDPLHLIYGFIVDALFILILDRIISPQQIIEIRNGIKVKPIDDEK